MNGWRDDAASRIGLACSIAKSVSKRLTVVVVANVNGRTAVDADLDLHTIRNDFFSDLEYTEIVGALQAMGAYVLEYLEEKEFLQDLVGGRLDLGARPHSLVYSTAQKPLGAGRTALVPSICRLYGLPVCNSDPHAVALSRHKFHVQQILQACGISTPASWLFDCRKGWLLERRPSPGTRVIVKATYEAASIGLDEASVRTADDGLEGFLQERSRALKQPVTVQEFVSGYEVEVPVFELNNPFALGAAGIRLEDADRLGERVLTFETVGRDDYQFYDFYELNPRTSEEICRAAEQVFEAIGMRGIGRIDFRIRDTGQWYVTDVTDNPHLTPHGSVASCVQWHGFEYKDVMRSMIGLNCNRLGWTDTLR